MKKGLGLVELFWNIQVGHQGTIVEKEIQTWTIKRSVSVVKVSRFTLIVPRFPLLLRGALLWRVSLLYGTRKVCLRI